ncbi:MAG: hypothetical protein ACPKNR_12185 [Pleomorphochaeta sp.]
MKKYDNIIKKTINDVMNLSIQRSFIENRVDGWVDMKINPSSLEDIYYKNIWCAKEKIYSWIQGRALETISEYIKNIEYTKIDKTLLIQFGDSLYSNLISIVKDADYINNKKTIKFVFDINESKYNTFNYPTISDMFVLRGLLSYASIREFVDDYEILRNKLRYIIEVSINGSLINDQISFDNGDTINYFEDRVGIEGSMLALGASQILYDNSKNINDLLFGYYSIRNIISLFSMELGDKCFIIDYIDLYNKPIANDTQLINNPGHCIEIIGLALQFIRINKEILVNNSINIDSCIDTLIKMGLSHFSVGRNLNNTINLKVNLIDNTIVNNCCPWWSSFEALRMFSEIYYLNKDIKILEKIEAQLACINEIYLKDLDTFVPIQNVDSTGQIIDKIPATPDIDMGYHTSIPSFDFLKIFDSII